MLPIVTAGLFVFIILQSFILRTLFGRYQHIHLVVGFLTIMILNQIARHTCGRQPDGLLGLISFPTQADEEE